MCQPGPVTIGPATNPITCYVGAGNYDAPLVQWTRTACEDASDSWSARTAVKFDYRGSLVNFHPSSNNANTVLYSSIDGSGGLAGLSTVTLCSGCTHEIIRGHIHIEQSGYTWYKGGSGTVPSGQLDLWSVVAHELGHWIRLGDLPDSDSTCPADRNRATMCTPVYTGDSSQRVPATEDVQSANDASSSP